MFTLQHNITIALALAFVGCDASISTNQDGGTLPNGDRALEFSPTDILVDSPRRGDASLDSSMSHDLGKVNCFTLSCGPSQTGCSCIWSCSDQQFYQVDCTGQGQQFDCQCTIGDAGVGGCTVTSGVDEACTINRCCAFPF